MSAGWKSARITPLDGLAFLISAITAGSPLAMAACRALAKPRTGGAPATRAFNSANGMRALRSATSCDLRARMVLRMSLMDRLPGRRCCGYGKSENSGLASQHTAGGDVLLHARTGTAIGDHRACAHQTIGDAVGHAGHIQRGA